MLLTPLTERLMCLEPQELTPSEFYATLYAHALAILEPTLIPTDSLLSLPSAHDPTNSRLTHEINFHALFVTIHLNGGYHNISTRNLWGEMAASLTDNVQAPKGMASIKHPGVKGKYLKKVYERWLLDYEEVSTSTRRRYYNKVLSDSMLGPTKIRAANRRLCASIREMTLATADHLATGCGLVDQAPPTPRNQDEDGIHPVEAREAGSARPTYTSLLDPRVRDWAQAEALLATYREYAQSMRLNAKPLEKEDCRRFLWDEVEDDEMIADDDGLWGGCRGNGLKRGRKMMSKKKTLKLEDYLEAYQDNFAQRLALELGENGDME